jgi:molecular chaperone DnaJ
MRSVAFLIPESGFIVLSKRDYYEILDVNKNASETEIKKAYRRLAIKFHPDKNPGDKAAEEKFKELSEAYSVLSDSQKRATYDQFGHAGVNGGGGFPGGGGFSGGGGFEDVFGDIFGDLFGGGSRQGGRGQRGQRGDDLRYNLTISFEEAAFGVEKKLKLPRKQTCETCHGSGARPGTSAQTCSTCRGAGQVRYQQGFFTMQRPCPDCHGEGKIISDPCPECRGSGLIQKKRSLSLKVPPGVENGTRLKLSAEGEAGLQGGMPGDLYVVISVEDHPIFQREGQNVLCEIPISFVQATLGCDLLVPTLEGKVNLKVPGGTQSGKIFRLSGKGIVALQGYGRGDQMVILKVEVPTKLNSRQRELLQEFAKEGGEDIHPQGKGFIDKVKELFD